MKNIYLWAVVFGFAAGGAQAIAADGKAPGTCYIYVQSSAPCKGAMLAGPDALRYYTVNAWFGDTEPLANLNAGRCLERAQEYKYWCEQIGPQGPVEAKGGSAAGASSVAVVYAFYQVNGINVIGAAAASDNKTYLHDGVARFLRWKD